MFLAQWAIQKPENGIQKWQPPYQLGQVSVFDNLKLRGAWCQTGNMPQAKSKYTTMSSANIGGVNGLSFLNIRNSSIKPERTTELEIGSDFSLLNGLMTVEATYYQQNIEDLILLVDLAPSSGATEAWENGGKMETSGLELALGLNPTRFVELGGPRLELFYDLLHK